ncbi:DUF5682 family protein [Prosthecomicrobium hirschii]|uniref:DUF5682 family protein n=1 Tax=Prosthecodimorpha hirschii TaxID=665126 RepID=UPI00222020C5|nr:DUF5682 family protein [Prosthecomicrobium hirschii]MCW1841341.1 DUF5682 family protein [Prosthecomicrobium hirschii]
MASGGAEIIVFPIRHHSPACAAMLAAALDEIRPSRLLIEAPADFADLIAALADPRIVAPVAIVSMPDRTPSEADSRAILYYPLCDHSPELVALRWAFRNGVPVTPIDLPSRHAAMLDPAAAAAGGPILLTREEAFTAGAYVRALCERTGARDGNEVWDRLFESRIGHRDWRGFFQTVETYCRHLRETIPPQSHVDDGRLAREAHMRHVLAEASAAGGRLAVVVGGLHVPALEADAGPISEPSPPGRLALVRYDYARLDRAGGYAAGLPSPGFYERLARAFAGDATATWDGLALDILVGFADRLRRDGLATAFRLPTMLAAAETASRLAALRGLPGPGRCELIDAVQTTAVKEAVEAGTAPVLAAFETYLTGDRIGEVPPGRFVVPLVEDVRARARALGFSLDRAAPASRVLDLQREPRHRAASRFLHALDLIGAGFARRTAGPDPGQRRRSTQLHETWSYAWGPAVEAALFDRLLDGDRLETVCRTEILRRLAGLAEDGRGREAAPAAALYAVALRAGLAGELAPIASRIEAVLAEADALPDLLVAFRLLAAPAPGAPEQTGAALIGLCYRRLAASLATLADLEGQQAIATARGLADLAADLTDPENLAALDRTLMTEAVLDLIDGDLPPFLLGAVAAVARLLGCLGEAAFERRVQNAFAGVYEQASERAAVLSGILAAVPRFLVGSPTLIGMVDRFLAGLDDVTFLAVLPELRLAFSTLNPIEIERVAAQIPGLHRTGGAPNPAAGLTALELAENTAIGLRLAERWRSQGLTAWLAGET